MEGDDITNSVDVNLPVCHDVAIGGGYEMRFIAKRGEDGIVVNMVRLKKANEGEHMIYPNRLSFVRALIAPDDSAFVEEALQLEDRDEDEDEDYDASNLKAWWDTAVVVANMSTSSDDIDQAMARIEAVYAPDRSVSYSKSFRTQMLKRKKGRSVDSRDMVSKDLQHWSLVGGQSFPPPDDDGTLDSYAKLVNTIVAVQEKQKKTRRIVMGVVRRVTDACSREYYVEIMMQGKNVGIRDLDGGRTLVPLRTCMESCFVRTVDIMRDHPLVLPDLTRDLIDRDDARAGREHVKKKKTAGQKRKDDDGDGSHTKARKKPNTKKNQKYGTHEDSSVIAAVAYIQSRYMDIVAGVPVRDVIDRIQAFVESSGPCSLKDKGTRISMNQDTLSTLEFVERSFAAPIETL